MPLMLLIMTPETPRHGHRDPPRCQHRCHTVCVTRGKWADRAARPQSRPKRRTNGDESGAVFRRGVACGAGGRSSQCGPAMSGSADDGLSGPVVLRDRSVNKAILNSERPVTADRPVFLPLYFPARCATRRGRCSLAPRLSLISHRARGGLRGARAARDRVRYRSDWEQ